MFDRFTENARRVMGYARREAQRFHHERIGPEHILLGIIQVDGGVARQILDARFSKEEIRQKIEGLITEGPEIEPSVQIPFTPSAMKVVELSLEESRTLGHNFIGTGHLLLAFLHEPMDEKAARVLGILDLNLEVVRRIVDEAPADRFLISEAEYEHAAMQSLEKAAANRNQEHSPIGHVRPTENARKALGFARRDAQRRYHSYIGTDHILLGLMQVERCIAARVLKSLNLDLDQLRREVEKVVGPGPRSEIPPEIPYSSRAYDVIMLATEEAAELGQYNFGSGHLLLGLCRESEGIAAHALVTHGVVLEDVRQIVFEILGASIDEETSELERATLSGEIFDHPALAYLDRLIARYESQVEEAADYKQAKRLKERARQAKRQRDRLIVTLRDGHSPQQYRSVIERFSNPMSTPQCLSIRRSEIEAVVQTIRSGQLSIVAGRMGAGRRTLASSVAVELSASKHSSCLHGESVQINHLALQKSSAGYGQSLLRLTDALTNDRSTLLIVPELSSCCDPNVMGSDSARAWKAALQELRDACVPLLTWMELAALDHFRAQFPGLVEGAAVHTLAALDHSQLRQVVTEAVSEEKRRWGLDFEAGFVEALISGADFCGHFKNLSDPGRALARLHLIVQSEEQRNFWDRQPKAATSLQEQVKALHQSLSQQIRRGSLDSTAEQTIAKLRLLREEACRRQAQPPPLIPCKAVRLVGEWEQEKDIEG